MRSRHDGLEHRVPSVGAVNIAGTKRTSFQVTELVEHEEGMIAGAFVMAVQDAHLLFAMGRTDARIHVEHAISLRPYQTFRPDVEAGLDVNGSAPEQVDVALYNVDP